MLLNYEAWHEEEQIYSGFNKEEMVDEIKLFVKDANLGDSLADEDIESLNRKALSDVGIKVYINKW